MASVTSHGCPNTSKAVTISRCGALSRPSSQRSAVFAHIDGNSFYASCEQVFDPDAARRPCVVLSNNDGCIVAATQDAKACGLEMFRPFFQLKHLLAGKGAKVFSSNYTLYHDMQQRMISIYRQHAEEVEVYSIDECFLTLGQLQRDRLASWATTLRTQVLRWTGVPTGVGVAPTKMLAKLANHMAKRDPLPGQPDGVCALLDAEIVGEALDRVELDDLWGINRGSIRRLAKLGVTTPREFRDADANRVREHLGVVGQRQVLELRGESCLAIETVTPNRKNVCVSRSFPSVLDDPTPLGEAVTTFACQAAVKLRAQDLAAQHVQVFIQTDRHAPVEQFCEGATVRLTVASSDSREIARAARACLAHVYTPRHAYKKVGVMLLNLQKRERVQQGLFEHTDQEAAHRLMQTLDRINHDHGAGAVRLASASPFVLRPSRTWHLRTEHVSPAYTTRWSDLPVARTVSVPCATAITSAPPPNKFARRSV